MITLKASDYQSRGELEEKVLYAVGLTPELKPDYQISGSLEDLARLHLSPKSVFHGIRCVSTDTKEEITVNKVSRGEEVAFGLNGNTKKPKTKQ